MVLEQLIDQEEKWLKEIVVVMREYEDWRDWEMAKLE